MRRLPALRSQRTTATLAAAVVALAATTAAAAGDRGATPRPSAQAATQITTSGAAVARCPSGRVVSGGFGAPAFGKEDTPVVRLNSEAVGRSEWRVDAVMFGDDGGDDGQTAPSPPPVGTIVSYAYCAKTPGPIKTRASTFQVQAGAIGTATARCGRGQRVIAGGFASPGFDAEGGAGVLTLSSRKAGKRGWTVEGINVNSIDGQPAPPAPLTAIARCLKGGPKLIERSQQFSVTPEQFRTFDIACPAGNTAVSGGFDGNIGPLAEDFIAAGAVESFRMRRAAGWTTSAVSVDESVGATITGYVYCVAEPGI